MMKYLVFVFLFTSIHFSQASNLTKLNPIQFREAWYASCAQDTTAIANYVILNAVPAENQNRAYVKTDRASLANYINKRHVDTRRLLMTNDKLLNCANLINQRPEGLSILNAINGYRKDLSTHIDFCSSYYFSSLIMDRLKWTQEFEGRVVEGLIFRSTHTYLVSQAQEVQLSNASIAGLCEDYELNYDQINELKKIILNYKHEIPERELYVYDVALNSIFQKKDRALRILRSDLSTLIQTFIDQNTYIYPSDESLEK